MIETGYEKILGIQSMQVILEYLSVYETISIKELKTFTGFSARTIHDNLKSLINQGMVLLHKRGTYKLADSRAVQLLAKFYKQIVIELIGNILHEITDELDRGKTEEELEEDLNKLATLYKHWKPIFELYFPTAMQTILLSLQ